MHNEVQVIRALELKSLGYNHSQIARMTGINRRTIIDWVQGKVPNFEMQSPGPCQKQCGLNYKGPIDPYVYLLGLYLGDGCISKGPRAYRLRIACCTAYPALMDLCENSIQTVMPKNKVGRIVRTGYTEIFSDSKHWPCLFPQYGAGPKHKRLIQLEPWQQNSSTLIPDPWSRALFTLMVVEF